MFGMATGGEMETPTVVLVLIASLLAAPIIYTLDKMAAMENHLYLFLVAIVVLLIFVLLSVAIVRRGSDKMVQREIFFYVWSLFAFTGIVDLFIGLELDGYVKGFMEFYLREGEPYLRSSYGTMINWWDGIGHYSMYITMLALLCSGRDFRLLGLYWVGSISHSMIVFLPGNVTGNKGLRWSYLLNVPYVVFPIYGAIRFLREGMKSKKKQVKVERAGWNRPAEVLMAVWFVLAAVMATFRFMAVMGCKEKITLDYISNIEPFLMDPSQYGKMQALVYFYYFMPFYVGALCCLLYPGQQWIKDWSIIHAGASAQAQFVFITCSLKWRTAEEHRVPDEMYARTIFWLVNVSLLLVPHLHALYCNRSEVTEFVAKLQTPVKKEEAEDQTQEIHRPVTRQQKKRI